MSTKMARSAIGFQWSLLTRIFYRSSWNLKRGFQFFFLRMGFIAGPFLLCMFLAVSALGTNFYLRQSIDKIRHQEKVLKRRVEIPTSNNDENERKKLQAFYAILLPYIEVPAVIQQILVQAESDGLGVRQGEYRPEIDVRGGFVRYRISLPLKGNAHLIHRHIVSVLLKQKAIALESIQFKRERANSTDVDVRLQWVLLTNLPVDMSDLEGEKNNSNVF